MHRLGTPDKTLVALFGLCAGWILAKTVYCACWSWIQAEPVNLFESLRLVLSSWLQWLVFLPLVHRAAQRHSLFATDCLLEGVRHHLLAGSGIAAVATLLKYLMVRPLMAFTPADALLVYFPSALLVYFLLALAASALLYLERRRARASEFLRVETGRGRTALAVADIEHVSAHRNYAEVHTRGGSYLLRETMKTLERRLGEHGFERVHRSHIVNAARVREVSTDRLTMASGRAVPVGRTYRSRAAALVARGERAFRESPAIAAAADRTAARMRP